MIFRKNDSEGSLFTGMHFSDWFVFLIAAMLTAVAAYLLLTPEDFGAKFAKAAKVITSPEAQKTTPGEAPVMIFNDKKK
jgi:hypothetical protein